MQIVGTAGTLPTTCGKEKSHSQFFAAAATGRLALLNDPDNDDDKNNDHNNDDGGKKKALRKPCKTVQNWSETVQKRFKNIPATIRKCSEIGPKKVQMAEQKVAFLFSARGYHLLFQSHICKRLAHFKL